MSNKACSLPKGSTKIKHSGYEEVYVPAVRHQAKNERLIKISELPSWA
jgi:pre-mRNA-splicing helicase BRR2